MTVSNFVCQFQPARTKEEHIRDQEIDLCAMPGDRQGVLGAYGREHFITLPAERARDERAQVEIGLDQENDGIFSTDDRPPNPRGQRRSLGVDVFSLR